jgi:hypothetical protein
MWARETSLVLLGGEVVAEVGQDRAIAAIGIQLLVDFDVVEVGVDGLGERDGGRDGAACLCSLANVQALAGHKSIKTTQRYLGVSTELRHEAVNRLNFAEETPAEG